MMRDSDYYTVSLFHTSEDGENNLLGFMTFIAKAPHKVTMTRFNRFIEKAARLAHIPIKDVQSCKVGLPMIPHHNQGNTKPKKVFIPSDFYLKRYGIPTMPYVHLY